MTIQYEGPLYYNEYDMIQRGFIKDYQPIGIRYHVQEDDTVCIDFIEQTNAAYDSCYLPGEIEGKPVTRLGDGKSACIADGGFNYVCLPDCLTAISDYAFLNVRSMSGIYSYHKLNVAEIGLQAFYGTSMQANAERGHGAIYVGSILYRCFAQSESFTVSETCTQIAADAFAHNHAVSEIVMPEALTAIGDGAFYDCTALRQITVPDTVTALGTGAFVNCGALEQAALGSGLKEIGDDLFYGCDALKTVTAPKGSQAESWCKANGLIK